jgi:hypothetical protein
MPGNLWEIEEYTGLKTLLQNAHSKFVVISIITDETEENIRKMTKILLKEKSKLYPKITFLFYKAKDEDICDKMIPLFNSDKSEYPTFYHLWNGQKILEGGCRANTKNFLEKTFKKHHNDYIAGYLPDDEVDQEEQEELCGNGEQSEPVEESEDKIKNKKNQNVNFNIPPKNNSIQQNANIYQPIQHKDPKLEKKKFIEKIELLRKKQESVMDDFVMEYKNRKDAENLDEDDDKKRKEKREKREKKDKKDKKDKKK